MYELLYYLSTLMSAFTFVTLIAGVLVFKRLLILWVFYVIMLSGYTLIYSVDMLALYQDWTPWLKPQDMPSMSVLYNQSRLLSVRIVIEAALLSHFIMYWKLYARG